MNFLVDVQFPANLSRLLAEAEHDSFHTSELALVVLCPTGLIVYGDPA